MCASLVLFGNFDFYFDLRSLRYTRLPQLVTMDETWLCHYDLETKQQSMEWQHSGSPHPKKLEVQKPAGKVLASIFWDQDGILLQTINAEYYSSLLVQLKDILKVKRRGKVTIFLPTRRSMLLRRPGWTDNLLNFEWLQKLQQWPKKCIELRGEYVE
jgi:hypothetical protein